MITSEKQIREGMLQKLKENAETGEASLKCKTKNQDPLKVQKWEPRNPFKRKNWSQEPLLKRETWTLRPAIKYCNFTWFCVV